VPRTSFGTAYFGVRDLDHAARDLDAIAAAGHDWVLLPMTQDDAVWERSTFRALVLAARAAGLEPIVSPWGGEHFGGEGIAGPLSVPEWITRVADTGALSLHIDEPKAGGTSVASILDLWAERIWLTIEPHRVGFVSAADAERVDVLGADAYHGDLAERVAATVAAGGALGRLDLAWVQAFRIRAGEEGLVRDAVHAMADVAPRVGIWGWKGSTGRGDLRSESPAAVASAVAEAIDAVHAAQGSKAS
jgi:hypothetical protein